MCGIVGLLVRKPELEETLGRLVVPMFHCMAERGPDSAGIAVFGERRAGGLRASLYAKTPGFDFAGLEGRLRAEFGAAVALEAVDNHAIASFDAPSSRFKWYLAENEPDLTLLSIGESIEVWKDEGNPKRIATKYGFSSLKGTHAIGHTRMATESRVSPAHAHPYTAGEDFCLVHNGSLSNPYMLRRKLEASGIHFETDNDTEAVCRYLEWRISQGDDLEAAIERAFGELDGFYTLLIGTKGRMTLVRDPVACKPAVVAETDDYVAVASEFRSLAHLPKIDEARIFEPLPERIYSWQI